jgi:hypothetical protein
MDVLDAKSFNLAIRRLKHRPRPTALQVRDGASQLLDTAGMAEMQRMAADLPDLQSMLTEWTASDRPLTSQDLAVMRQAHVLWLRFSNLVYERALHNPG